MAEGTAISSSPERLLAVTGDRVESRPIKGTAARDPDPALDRLRAEALLRSAKDRAELLMITDLVRNDLGKVCAYGSVRVPALRELESFPHLHHLVSTVTGRLRPGATAVDALLALFPGGSITGAPKRRAMQLLRELEPCARGVYTGSVGWLGFDRSADFSIAIRSGHLRDGVFCFGAGGGIVADSDPDAEWEELLLKTRAPRFALRVGDGAAEETRR
jgi:para-aminobenzoate synthetase component 1